MYTFAHKMNTIVQNMDRISQKWTKIDVTLSKMDMEG